MFFQELNERYMSHCTVIIIISCSHIANLDLQKIDLQLSLALATIQLNPEPEIGSAKPQRIITTQLL